MPLDCEVGQYYDAYNDPRDYSPAREEEDVALAHIPSTSTIAGDTIDQLGQPTRCRLMMTMGPMTVEVARGVVYPQDRFINEEVPIRAGFAAVRIDIVHENMMEAQLEVPTDDDNGTLRLAQYTKVQWRRSLILTESATPPPPPPKRTSPPPPPPPPSGPSQKEAASSAPPVPPEAQDRTATSAPPPPQPGPSQKKAASSAPQGRPATSAPQRPAPQRPPKKSPAKKKAPPKKSLVKKALAKTKKTTTKHAVSQYVMDNPLYKPGEPQLTEAELKSAGESTRALHEYYMTSYNAGKQSIIVQYEERHFLCKSNYFLVAWPTSPTCSTSASWTRPSCGAGLCT